MSPASLLRLLLSLSSLIGAALGQSQVPLKSTSHTGQRSKHAITPELSEFIDNLLGSSNIPGISLGVVHTSSDGTHPEIELQSWGRRNEGGNGNDLSSDVSLD